MADVCLVCGKTIDEQQGLVLVIVRGFSPGAVGSSRAHCSESCVRETVRDQRAARAAARQRWILGALLVVTLPTAAVTLWHRYRAPWPRMISFNPPQEISEPSPLPEPIRYGPAWPPTDADWRMAFDTTRWVYPLPGPVRRAGIIDSRIFGPDAPPDHPALCLKEGRCGVDLGGDLWGEHVYAAHDGVVDRLHGASGDERGGQYVRLSHFGGMVYTQYFHLAAISRHLMRGVHVKAGELIGLLGDTGVQGPRGHLHFTLSVRPSSAFSEVYWDPTPWMVEWPLRLPPKGTVAGLSPPPRSSEGLRRRR